MKKYVSVIAVLLFVGLMGTAVTLAGATDADVMDALRRSGSSLGAQTNMEKVGSNVSRWQEMEKDRSGETADFRKVHPDRLERALELYRRHIEKQLIEQRQQRLQSPSSPTNKKGQILNRPRCGFQPIG